MKSRTENRVLGFGESLSETLIYRDENGAPFEPVGRELAFVRKNFETGNEIERYPFESQGNGVFTCKVIFWPPGNEWARGKYKYHVEDVDTGSQEKTWLYHGTLTVAD